MNLIHLTIYTDAVKAEIHDFKARVIGWFQDEVSAIGAACEHITLSSAISPDLRRLPPELTIRCDYRKMNSGHCISRFTRGTTTRIEGTDRRIVMLPGIANKDWLPKRAA